MKKPFMIGVIAVSSPIPMTILTIMWCWILCFGVGIGILQYDTIPEWLMTVSLLPLCISPLFGCFGMVYGIIKRKEHLSWLGILLSVICLIENFLLIYGIGYLGSRFQFEHICSILQDQNSNKILLIIVCGFTIIQQKIAQTVKYLPTVRLRGLAVFLRGY